jgi:hypothetical protein
MRKVSLEHNNKRVPLVHVSNNLIKNIKDNIK